MSGALPSDRASRPAAQAPAGLGDTATIPSAVLDEFERLIERGATKAPWVRANLAHVTTRIDPNGARLFDRPCAVNYTSYHPCDDVIAALAVNALAQAIEARRAETGTGSVHESAVAESDAP